MKFFKGLTMVIALCLVTISASASKVKLFNDIADWKITGTALKLGNTIATGEGVGVSYTMTTNINSAKITFANRHELSGKPDGIVLRYKAKLPIKNFNILVLPANAKTAIKFEKNGNGTSSGKCEINLGSKIDLSDETVWPLTFISIIVTPSEGAREAGEFSFTEMSVIYTEDDIAEIPNKDGMNLKGKVTCDNKPIANVLVSDGINTTHTDNNGIYYLSSTKECGYVFICNPKGYKPAVDGRYPEFYKNLRYSNDLSRTERLDFDLIKENDNGYIALFLADIQIAARNSDKKQFETYAIPDINATINEYKKQGKNVYLITLGDQTYDEHWSKGCKIPEINELLLRINADAIYNCTGNHDNNPDIAGDWEASVSYRETWGPTYYSFNIGNIHYVVLDNIEYKNQTGGRDYTCNITSNILEWLKKDLGGVSPNTTIALCMHAPMFVRPQCISPNTLGEIKIRFGFGEELRKIVERFDNVLVFSGHEHNTHIAKKYNIKEYNVAAVCGHLWWPSHFKPGNILCQDGTPGGYRIMEVNGDVIKTYYKGIGFDKSFQFRSYDLNECHITPERYAPSLSDKSLFTDWIANGKFGYDLSDYDSDGKPLEPNRILVNVFGYDEDWKIEIFEDGIPLVVDRVSTYDPYSIISDGAQRFENTGHNGANPMLNCHMFLTKSKSDNSHITIKVTDNYGDIYTEEMKRPKKLDFSTYMPNSQTSEISPISINNKSKDIIYYNLHGQVIKPSANNHLPSGVYIRKQGNHTDKIIIK